MRAFLLFFLACASCATPTPTYVGPFQTAALSSVLVTTSGGHGSGVVVSDKCVLTASHVVDKESSIAISDRKGNAIEINYVKEDIQRDLALVCADKSLGIPSIQIAETMPELYAPVFIYGYPLSFNRVITTGLYQGFGMISAPAAPGDSGAGVFDAHGRLVGVLQAIAVHDGYIYTHLTYMADLDVIRPFLRPFLGNLEVSK